MKTKKSKKTNKKPQKLNAVIINMIVAGFDPDGYPGLLPVRIRCTADQIKTGEYTGFAEDAASTLHWEPCIAFAAMSFKLMACHFDWDDAAPIDYTEGL